MYLTALEGTQGYVETVLLRVPQDAAGLVVDVDTGSLGGRLQGEVWDVNGAVVQGYTRDAAELLVDQDGAHVECRWAVSSLPPIVQGGAKGQSHSASRGFSGHGVPDVVRLRFYLSGGAKLYSFAFTGPPANAPRL